MWQVSMKVCIFAIVFHRCRKILKVRGAEYIIAREAHVKIFIGKQNK